MENKKSQGPTTGTCGMSYFKVETSDRDKLKPITQTGSESIT